MRPVAKKSYESIVHLYIYDISYILFYIVSSIQQKYRWMIYVYKILYIFTHYDLWPTYGSTHLEFVYYRWKFSNK